MAIFDSRDARNDLMFSRGNLDALRNSGPSAGQIAPTAEDDQQSMSAQQQALNGLQREIAMNGWSPDERKVYEHQMATASGVAAGQRAGLIQQMIARGMSPGLASSIANQAGQQQQALMGNEAGWAAEGDAQSRKQHAMSMMAGLGNQMGSQGIQASEFNAGQNLRGQEQQMGNRLGISTEQQSESDQQRASNAQALGMGIEGGVGLGSDLIKTFAKSGRRDSGGG